MKNNILFTWTNHKLMIAPKINRIVSIFTAQLEIYKLFVLTAHVLHLRSVSRSWGINILIGVWKKFCLQFVCYSCGSCYGRCHFFLTKTVKFVWIYCKIWKLMLFIFIHMGLISYILRWTFNHCNSEWARSMNF